MRVDEGFASFWQGRLNPFAWACLASFPRAGARLTLYSYDGALDPPEGVMLRDARDICPDESWVRRMTVDGRPSVATFSDLFRYRMIRATGECWVDADLICLRTPPFSADAYVYCRQADFVSTRLVNNAVLRLPPDDPALADLIATAEAGLDRDLKWGALGPFLLTPTLEAHGLYGRAMNPGVCYPVEPELFWTLFLPSRRAEAAAKIDGAALVHLWSEAIRWTGWDLTVAPPPCSWLHDAFGRLGALARFARHSEESDVRRVMADAIEAAQSRGPNAPAPPPAPEGESAQKTGEYPDSPVNPPKS